jgi:hypothetical protein
MPIAECGVIEWGYTMVDEKDKTFTVKDKRHFTPEGEIKQEEKKEEPGGESREEAQKEEAQKTPLPEINFSSFIFSLSTSALLHFGEISDPISNKRERNLPLAKQTIDLLGMLKEKTKGNLLKEEEELLDTILFNLRMKYVEEAKKG